MRSTQYFILSCILFIQCAQPSVPSGGAKDIDPPKISQTTFPNGSTNQPTNLRKLQFTFDENIQLGSTSDIMFSPRLTPAPEITAKAKKVIIKFSQPLEENTTYLINFGKSVKDYTEGNVLDSNIFAFSTGPEIDSLKLSGSVVDGYSRKPIKNAVVLLYKEGKDSALYSGKPQYYNITDEKGAFELPFLKEGSYQIFGLEDANDNLKYDLPEEKVYFSNKTLFINQDTSIELAVSPLIKPENFVSSYRWLSQYHLKVSLDKQTDSPISFSEMDTTRQLAKRYSITEDSIDVYFYSPITGEAIIMKWESTADTIAFESSIDSLDMPTSDTLLLNLESSMDRPLPYFEPLQINTNLRIKRINPGRAYFTHGVDTFPLVIKPADSSGFNFFIDFDWEQSADYTFYLPQGLLESFHGTQSLETVLNLSTDSEDNYSTLYLELIDWTGQSCIIQLESEEKVIDRKYLKSGETSDLVFEHLSPKKYDFRLIYDTNHNGTWDIGNYDKGVLPERVRLMTEGVETKRGFDFEVKWFLED